MHRSLIVAKVAPGMEQQVAQIFAESDETELPGIVGVRHRSLYRLDDLYVHLVETAQPSGPALAAARAHPEFVRISERLLPYISPYLATWRSPQDAVAQCFYHWDAPVVTTGSGR
ncbi:hypothetical protein GCM10027280_51380 [Micromonospora polyrhachis]|uniref:Cyclase n=1 Tax=Micromonospora polyrhachis TaxID=1282883 RepID=A0A7W7SVY3_9ACTN|nr:TcmI family type II polyketide cyclase [Micromonospora polyrhachis]MBB4961972.1 cyclase [Micromonospora polyrhachis]